MKHRNGSVFFTDSERATDYSITNQFAEHMEFMLVKDKITATAEDIYYALSMSVRDRLVRNWLRTQQLYKEKDVKKVYYLSLEFLMGRLLGNSLINMGFYDECFHILHKNGYFLEDIRESEKEMGLGNGGLGRLAACFLDSMATLELPAFGYGIRYEFGIFKQEILNGYQVEQPDNWLSYGNPWEILRREITFRVRFSGGVIVLKDEKGELKFDWTDTEDVLAVAYDIPVPGYKTRTVNNLRLWQAKATSEFNFKEFNSGNYLAAVESKNTSENISKVLYPNDTFERGKYLRLRQEYFFVSATLQDIIRKYRINHKTFARFAEKTAIQLNDTHPVLAIPELMRILLDEEHLGWDEAWDVTARTFAYTNHTVVPEALEEWPVAIFEQLLPRHLQIIYEINYRFLEFARDSFTKDEAVISRMSIIGEFPEKTIRMANLAIICCHTVNGVSRMHTGILKSRLFPEFNRIFPGKFINITNGITPRRWLKIANPYLSLLIDEKLGNGWAKDLKSLKELEKYLSDEEFLENWRHAKWLRKKILSEHIEIEHGIRPPENSLFDVQVKRFHEYKRQMLNILHVITLYNRIKDNPKGDFVPRTVIFSGKAAPAYSMAKLTIKLINSVADVINNDPEAGNKLKVFFLKNYSVTLAQKIIPAADLSEQISTAGFEASGTGNMKLALNGALTIGTLDGANAEIMDAAGENNMFIFGLTAEEVQSYKSQGYNPMEYYTNNPGLRRVIDMIRESYFNPKEPGIFQPLIDSLLKVDYYMLFADYDSYISAQDSASRLFLDRKEWTRKSILNTARMGWFSSDRAIKEYSRNVWHVSRVKGESGR
ncbi:MAG: glycogen/starch/alpha-glucan phosphorylase [Ignavibacteria bacterium]|jgi:starch phosphorylase|nr:glycogen/starch/alpha-glucan phosphorylase [Ignavibacteria bacterium]MCU7503498.1 glycogen/starch/alpha-glucan phosphorylase [Ignavibacteria bacterium]MCU7516170.1 glycogen/starch/alpha-glucan phosphorylase [Ignavibacteria bacterium]